MISIRDFAASHLPAIFSHLWSSTIFLALMLVAIVLLRNRLTATARFSLALIGIVKFAIPSALIAPLVRLLSDETPAALTLPLQLLDGTFRIQPPSAPARWPSVIVAMWLAVAILLIVRFALTRHRLVALSVRTARASESREVEALARARRRVGVRRSIDIARAALPEAPAVLRIFRPLVVLPMSGCDELSDAELEALLCHECAHVARHDNLIARIESFISALFWFHPLIWIAQRITVIERERACDEVVSGSADEREIYLIALAKFCHAAIAPRLPGVSCMATSKLKERMDYVMNYSEIQSQAPSPRRLTVLASAALIVFTVSAAFVGGERAFAAGDDPFAIRIAATRSGESIVLEGSVSENKTMTIVAAPKLQFAVGEIASSKTSSGEIEVAFAVRPGAGDQIAVDVTIEREGKVVQKSSLIVTPDEGEPASQYSGEPISLRLKDADLRDVIGTFGKITGFAIRMDDSVRGTVSVNWENVPWDQAFDEMLKEQGMTYRIEGSAIHVTGK